MTTDAVDKLISILETGSGEYINYETLGVMIKLAKSVKTELRESTRECDILEKMVTRYEKLRKLNVSEFRELYLKNLSGEGSFDVLVDKL
jgi:hypothetical protein